MNRNIEVVRKGIKALARWDVEAALAYCDRELEFVSLVGEVEGRSYHGHDGIRAFVVDLKDAWEVWQPVPERFESAGDMVLATGKSRLRGKGSGVEIEIDWGQLFRVRDGKVVWSRIYSDPAAARREFEQLTT